LAIPAFSTPVDCTSWVTGGLWPAELSKVTAETATLAEYLKTDLQRIVEATNDMLKTIQRAGLAESVRHEEEARVIEEAQARAVQRVESTTRQLHTPAAERSAGSDVDRTQVVPAVTDVEPPAAAPADAAPQSQVTAVQPMAGQESESSRGRHRGRADDNTEEAAPAPATEIIEAVVDTESADQRLRRLLAFVARQAPRLNWGVGDRPDSSTVIATDLAHGWIPPGITLPKGVRLLPPQRRTGTVAALVADTTRNATYFPGDRLGWPDDFAPTTSSVRPRELPPVREWERLLSDATHRREGLPRMVHTLVEAAAEGARVREDEVDLLRVHLDTALHQLLLQYPDVDLALLLNCLLLAAAEAAVTGDSISSNYHLAWFRKLHGPAAGR
jgi:hypothetical protein